MKDKVPVGCKPVTPIDHKPLWVNQEEAGLLLYLVGKYDKEHALYHKLREVQEVLRDQVQQLAEIVARAKANGHWSDTENVLREVRKQHKKEKKKRHRHTEEAINCLPPEQMKALLNGELVAEANGELRPPSSTLAVESNGRGGSEGYPFAQPELHVIKQPTEFLMAQPEEDTSPPPPVASDEAKKLEVPKRDRGLRGGLGS